MCHMLQDLIKESNYFEKISPEKNALINGMRKEEGEKRKRKYET